MALKEQIVDDIKAALLGGNRFRADTLRNLKAAVLDEEVRLGARDTGLADAAVEKIIAKEIKKRRESARMYRENNRPELAEPEENELNILEEYMPEQVSEQELELVIRKIIDQLDVSDIQSMGKVIGIAKQQLGSSVDGAMLAKKVREALA